jgi:ATP-dependent helicase YprA (DUF1998 family)
MFPELERTANGFIEYIEAAYHLSNPVLAKRRRSLLETNGIVSQLPYIESTARYETGRRFADLAIPESAKSLLSALAAAQVVFNPPYSHQADALESVLGQSPRNLIVTTGTGSGKTETFLLPILGRLAREASEQPQRFGERAVRALLLYPMNALVNDQLARLRLLFGSKEAAGWFVRACGRPAKFGRYTSRTPFPGVLPDDSQKLLRRFSGLKFYYDLEQSARNGDAKVAETIRILKQRGKWPVKIHPSGGEDGFSTWFGAGHWRDSNNRVKRTIERNLDPELLTRFEIQQAPPDLLVTNYSMLEYMMLRPIERNIFDASAAYYAANPSERFILVLDEAHLYRGAQGTEVAMLIRRLRARLGLALPERHPLRNNTLFFSVRKPLLDMDLASSRPFRWLLFGRNPILTRHSWVNNREAFRVNQRVEFLVSKKDDPPVNSRCDKGGGLGSAFPTGAGQRRSAGRRFDNPPVVDLKKQRIVCDSELGGQLKSYRAAAWPAIAENAVATCVRC